MADKISNLSVPQSLTNETKDKFDILLKAALKKTKLKNQKCKNSREKLVSEPESTTASSENLSDQNDLSKSNIVNDKNFILTKLISDSGSLKVNSNEELKVSTTFVKPPVPKPRKRKTQLQRQDSQSSTGTFKVTSPKILQHSSNSGSSSASRRTYEVPQVENLQEIGDLLLHNSPTATKIPVLSLSNSPDILEKAEVEDLSDSSISSSSESHVVIPFTKNEENLAQENIELQDLGKTSIQYENEVKPKPRPRKKKLKEISATVKVDGDLPANNKYNYERIIEILVHKTDRLQLNSFVIHPVVKIHIVDVTTGKYLEKSDKNRQVVFYYENGECGYILPVMTQIYNLQEKRSLFPAWEENIILNEDFQHLSSNDVIIFFEILDFSTFSSAHLQKLQKNYYNGWHRIAFAFLKPLGKNNSSNLNQRQRLQLYYPSSSKKHEAHKCYIWDWWKNNSKLKKYPSTLYITINGIISPLKIVETFRSKTPLQKEGGELIQNQNSAVGDDTITRNGFDEFKIKRNKSPFQAVQLPNKCLAKLECYENGCFLFKFSHNGSFLASVMQINELFFIVVFSVSSFEEVLKYSSHQGLIYSISWSKDDCLIITASADNTVAIWDFHKNSFLQILPHPSFIYACDISCENVIATGCYDCLVRIWTKGQESVNYDLNQELEGHKGYITSLCFNKKSSLFYTSDSIGLVIEWGLLQGKIWAFLRELQVLDLKGVIINQILLFPNEKKLLVHSRDSTLRIISLKNACVLHWLQGALNRRVQTFCSLSSCGNFVLAGSENGLAIVWNAKTGHDVKTYDLYTEENQNRSTLIHCAQFHPSDNVIGFSHYESNLPILLYFYDGSVQNQNVGLQKKTNVVGLVPKKNESNGQFVERIDSQLKRDDQKFNFKDILQKMDALLQ